MRFGGSGGQNSSAAFRCNLAALLLGLFLTSLLAAAPRDSRASFELLKKGKNLGSSEAEKLEERLVKKPDDDAARIQLLSYYTAASGEVSERSKALRLGHILWVVENDPREGFGLFQIVTGVLEVHCQGDGLADPEGFQRLRALWLRQLEKYPEERQIGRRAAKALRYCSPEIAERILLSAGDLGGLGELYAGAVLGLTGGSYDGDGAAGSDPLFRQSSFAQKAHRALVDSVDAKLVPVAALTLLQEGAYLWAKGKLDWDYTALGNQLLARAKTLAPDNVYLYTAPTALPAAGELPLETIRVGGNVQQEKLTKSVAPTYPPGAKLAGIQGTVRVNALIGPDGKILKLSVVSGPPELVDATLQAVQQWEYKPTLLNGRPFFILSLIDINYTLR